MRSINAYLCPVTPMMLGDTFSAAIATEIWKRLERSETGTMPHARAASMADAVEMGLLAINRAEQRAKGKHKEKPVQGTGI